MKHKGARYFLAPFSTKLAGTYEREGPIMFGARTVPLASRGSASSRALGGSGLLNFPGSQFAAFPSGDS